MSDYLRQRITDALCDANPLLASAGYSRRVEEYADAVMAVVQPELADAYNEFGKALETEAANTAREIDRAKQAEAEVERLKSLLVCLDLEGDAVIGTCGTAFGLDRWIGRPFVWKVNNGSGRGETTVTIEIRPRGDA